jgi:CRP-like cAMP-binding protein
MVVDDLDPLPLERSPVIPGRPPWLERVPGATLRTLPAGAVLAPPGRSRPGDLLVVERGAVCVGVTARSGRAALLAILGPGDCFGPAAGVGAGGPELRSLVPSVVLRAPAAGLRRACAADPTAAGELMGLMARQSEALSRRLELALVASVPERVLRTLRDLAGPHGVRRGERPGVEIVLPLTQEHLAALVGATRESVNRALRALVRQGAVYRRDGRYVLPGPS